MRDMPKHYRLKRNGRAFWEPTAAMRALGFNSIPCGPDGPEARAIAESWEAKWQATRRSAAGELVGAPTDRSRGYVYFLRTAARIKIGFAANPFTRAGAIKTGMSGAVEGLTAVGGTRRDEGLLHARLAAYRQSGEWFIAAAPVVREMLRTLALGRVDLRDQKPNERLERVGPRSNIDQTAWSESATVSTR